MLRLSENNNPCDVIVLTVATRETSTLRNAVASLCKFKYNYRVLGLGQPWLGYPTKIRLYHDALFSIMTEVDPNQIVVLMDAYDAIALREPYGLDTLFEKFGQPILLSL